MKNQEIRKYWCLVDRVYSFIELIFLESLAYLRIQVFYYFIIEVGLNYLIIVIETLDARTGRVVLSRQKVCTFSKRN